MLMRWIFPDPTPHITVPGLLLRAPHPSDYAQWRRVRENSHDFLQPFEPRWSRADLTRPVFNARLRHSLRKARSGTEFTFYIFLADTDGDELVGGITLSNIRKRVSMHANMGYWMSRDAAGNGIMTRAVGALLPFVFDQLKLQRLHAACLPHNIASRRVLEKSGFKEEGFADHYLKINGAWQDHVLYGLSRVRYEQNKS